MPLVIYWLSHLLAELQQPTGYLLANYRLDLLRAEVLADLCHGPVQGQRVVSQLVDRDGL